MAISRKEMQRRWSLFKSSVRNWQLITEANGIRLDLLRVGIDFGKSIGEQIPHNPNLWTDFEVNRKHLKRAQRLITAVDTDELALRFSVDDIDIMAPPGTTDDEIAQYQSLGFIIAGMAYIMVWSSVYAFATHMFEKNEALSTAENNRNYKLDMNFGTHKDPKVRERWKEIKKQEDFQPKKSVIESLTDGIADLGDFIKKKAGLGITIAVPILVGLLLWKNRK